MALPDTLSGLQCQHGVSRGGWACSASQQAGSAKAPQSTSRATPRTSARVLQDSPGATRCTTRLVPNARTTASFSSSVAWPHSLLPESRLTLYAPVRAEAQKAGMTLLLLEQKRIHCDELVRGYAYWAGLDKQEPPSHDGEPVTRLMLYDAGL